MRRRGNRKRSATRRKREGGSEGVGLRRCEGYRYLRQVMREQRESKEMGKSHDYMRVYARREVKMEREGAVR